MAIAKFSGVFNAFAFAYGVSSSVGPLRIIVGNGATGASSITVGPSGSITTDDGRVVFPLAITAPLWVGTGANQETVTPTGVSENADGSWTISGTFANLHGSGDTVSSGTYGLAEAVNFAHTQGGVVMVDGAWAAAGGVNATITTTKGFTNVSIIDGRGTATGAAFSYKAASNGALMTVSAVSWY